MCQSLFLFVILLFGFQCATLEKIDEDTINLDEKQKQDAEIHNILFGQNQQIQECLNITLKRKSMENKQNDTKQDKSLWTVVILREEKIKNNTLNIQQCTGSLIHPQVVLTAAHCTFNKSLTNLKVRAGESNRRPDRNATFHQERQIESIAFPKAYEPTNPKRDIALVFLKEPFNISAHVKTVCILPSHFPPNVNYTRCIVSGWETKNHFKVGHANFKKIDLPVIPSDKCQDVLRLTGLGEEFVLHKSFLCAGGEVDKAMLDGNGGAPLACPICGVNGRMIQVGVMSWGFKNAPLPEVFSSINSARHWIGAEMRKRRLKLSNCGIRWK